MPQPRSTDPDMGWLRRALKVSEQALPADVPVGALLVDSNGAIVAEACNRREIDQNPVGHAELLALQEAANKLNRWRLDDLTLYVTLEPCPMCAAAIAQSRMARVVFGCYDPVMGACGSRWNFLADTPPGVTQVRGGVLEEECQQQLHAFFRRLRQ